MTALLALGSALTYGIADFLGGRVATRAPALTTTLVTQTFGLLTLLVLAPVAGGEVSVSALWTGGVAGMAGSAGLVVYFRGLAIGPMGVVAPLAGAVGAVVPVLAGLFLGERIGLLAAVGIVVGLASVVLSSIDPDVGPPAGVPQPRFRAAVAAVRQGGIASSGPALGLLAGALFGLFFVLLDLTPEGSGMWPLLGARLTTVPLLFLLARSRGRPYPSRDHGPQLVASGVLDVAANALFLLATRTGLLVLAGLLVSLYPVVVVLLARQFLDERLDRQQQFGVLLALVAVVLISLG